MTRVLVQINSLALGGTQLNAVDFAVHLKRFGYQSVLVGPRDTLPDGPSLFEIAEERGVELEMFERPATTVGGARAMSKIARKHDAELIHIYGSWTAGPALWGPCRFGRIPLVVTVYEMAVDPTTPKSPGLIVGTRYNAVGLSSRRESVDWISPPVDVVSDDVLNVDSSKFLAVHKVEPNQLYVVMVTRLDDEMKAKSVELAIEAMAKISSERTSLIIVGGGDAEARIRELAQDMNAHLGRTAITLTGPLRDPRAAYAIADVVVGMGGSAARALSFSKPLIVAGEFGWFETFTSETADPLFPDGFWTEEVSPDPSQDLADCLDDLLDNTELRESLGSFGRKFAVENFALEAMSALQAGVYDQVMKRYGFRVWCREIPGEFARVIKHLWRTNFGWVLAAGQTRGGRSTNKNSGSVSARVEPTGLANRAQETPMPPASPNAMVSPEPMLREGRQS